MTLKYLNYPDTVYLPDKRNMLDITGVDLRAFTRKVYELSSPAGRGILHYVPDGLTDQEVDQLLKLTSPGVVLSLDYVKGRGCKMVVWKDAQGKLTISNPWFDHTEAQLRELLTSCGVTPNEELQNGRHEEDFAN